MKVVVQQAKGLTFIGKGNSNHWIVMDGPEKFKGSDAGIRPMELMLVSLGGCTGMDVISLLDKMKVKYSDFRIEVEAERAQEHPKVFTRIHIKYIIYGRDVDEQSFKKAIELSQSKYCSISAMLKKICNLTYSYEIVRKEEEITP